MNLKEKIIVKFLVQISTSRHVSTAEVDTWNLKKKN
jgi:hypothetical protein